MLKLEWVTEGTSQVNSTGIVLRHTNIFFQCQSNLRAAKDEAAFAAAANAAAASFRR